MAKAVTVTLILISFPDENVRHLEIEWSKAKPLECWSRDTHPVSIPSIVVLFSMLGARGRPRRGVAWYAFDSHRKQQKKFEKALAIACTRRTRNLGELEHLPWRMWRRLFRTNPSKITQNTSSSLSRIIGIPPPVSETIPSLML